jgi:hypothetical protein
MLSLARQGRFVQTDEPMYGRHDARKRRPKAPHESDPSPKPSGYCEIGASFRISA